MVSSFFCKRSSSSGCGHRRRAGPVAEYKLVKLGLVASAASSPVPRTRSSIFPGEYDHALVSVWDPGRRVLFSVGGRLGGRQFAEQENDAIDDDRFHGLSADVAGGQSVN